VTNPASQIAKFIDHLTHEIDDGIPGMVGGRTLQRTREFMANMEKYCYELKLGW